MRVWSMFMRAFFALWVSLALVLAPVSASFLPGMSGVQGAFSSTPGPTAVAVTAEGSASDAADLSTYTFASQSLGPVNNYRRSVVALWFRGGGSLTLSSVTLGGNAMTLLGTAAVNNAGGNTTYAAFFGLNTGVGTALASATDAAVVITLSGTASRAAIANYRVIKAGTALTPTDSDTSIVDDPTVSIDCQANGAIIGVFGTSDASAMTIAWTNLTEDYDIDPGENRRFSTAHDEFASAQTGRNITVTPSGAVNAPAFALIALGNG